MLIQVLFVQKKNIFNFETAILLSVLRAHGISAAILFEEQEGDELIDKVKGIKPIMVGFCTELAYILDVLEGEMHDNLRILKAVKESIPQVKTFVGGIFPAIIPEIIENYNYIDLLFYGDMENSLPEVAVSLKQGDNYRSVNGIIFRNNGKAVRNRPVRNTFFDRLPMPDIDAFLNYPGTFRKGYRLPFARGCPNNCSFCYQHNYKKTSDINDSSCPRYYPVSYLIESLMHIKSVEGRKFQTLYLVYGTFTHSKKFVREFCMEYRKKINVPYVIATRLDAIDDETAGLLKETGCSKVSISIESGVERLRNDVLKKNLSDSEIFRGMEILKKHGLRVGCSLIFGFPDETIDDAFATLDMARKIGADFIGPSIFVPIPNLQLTNYAIERGYLPAGYGIDSFRTTILMDHEYRQYKNIFCFAALYQIIPFKRLFKLLIKIPNNRFYSWIFHLQRIRGVMKYDLAENPLVDKLKYLFHAHYMIFFKNRRPDLVPCGRKLIYRSDKRLNRGTL